MGISIDGGTQKCLVCNGKFQIKMDDLGVPPISGNLHIISECVFIFDQGCQVLDFLSSSSEPGHQPCCNMRIGSRSHQLDTQNLRTANFIKITY